jgi:hypothetical protein
MTAKAPTMSTVVVRIINREVFICDLGTADPKAYRVSDFSWFKMNPR